MRIEVILYIYGAVCASMIVFNVVYNLVLKTSQPRLDKRVRDMEERVGEQLERIRRGEPVEEAHLERLGRKLSRVKNLMAFDRVLSPIAQDGYDSDGRQYLIQIQPVILYLAVLYQKRENIQAAYFSYILSRYMLQSHMPIQALQDVLLGYVQKDKDVYKRQHQIRATESCMDVFSPQLSLYPVLDPFNGVLEVKYNGFLLSYIKDLVSGANRSELSVSKYCLARSATLKFGF